MVFGSSLFTATAAATLFIYRNVQHSDYFAAIGAFTVVFGLGQATGPVFVEFFADLVGSLGAGLALGAAVLLLAALICALQGDAAHM